MENRREKKKDEDAQDTGTQQILHAALAAVPRLLACSGLRDEDRGRRTSGTLVLCAATSRSDHKMACGEDAYSHFVV